MEMTLLTNRLRTQIEANQEVKELQKQGIIQINEKAYRLNGEPLDTHVAIYCYPHSRVHVLSILSPTSFGEYINK